ncbi:HAMP domain-containing protein [Oligoflexus tunisiensis]|uniref:HAMP domain-containing protein n=1 Tax=Oligoflexus tunisiensis TaxID=708132 RepID=UPI00114CCF22|nr:HAMP domain-containing protein [Oligoflexus tunisiensis]
MKQKFQRQKQRLILINRDFQFRYTGAAVLVGLLSTILTTSVILYPLYQFEILRIPRFLPWPVLGVMAMAALLNVLLVGFMGILITHRLAGPMYSLVRQFRRVEEGRWYGQMKIRDGDDMRYVVRNFNAMLDAINKQTQMDFEKLRHVRELLVADKVQESERIASALLELKTLDEKMRERLHAENEHDIEMETEPPTRLH